MFSKFTKFLAFVTAWLCSSPLMALASPGCEKLTVDGIFRHSHVVFTGKVGNANRKGWGSYDIRYDGVLPYIHLTEFDRARTTFDVATVWKGEVTITADIIHSVEGECFVYGYNFQPGEEWLIYARRVRGELHIFDGIRLDNLCDANVELAALGMGRPPMPNRLSLADAGVKFTALFLLLLFFGWAFWQTKRKYGIQRI